MWANIAIGYLVGGLFYMGFEFAFMIYKARILHRHKGNLFYLTILFIPCALAWPYFAILRILHNEENDI